MGGTGDGTINSPAGDIPAGGTIPAEQPRLAAVDWGTSSFRLWLVGAGGTVLAERRAAEGMQAVPPGGFEAVLRGHLAAVGVEATDAPLPVVLCGMVGARQGWREAAYADCPADPAALAAAALRFDLPGLDLAILPGVARRDADRPDVMRGEETQLAGLLALEPDYAGVVVLPGTHAKWATVAGGRIADFRTVMTGELHALLAGHSILRHSIGDARPSGDPASPGFRAGLARGLADPAALAGEIFALRAGDLLFARHGAEVADRLSGLLIGAEVGAMLAGVAKGAAIGLVAAGPLAGLYRAAFVAAGRPARDLDADVLVRAGLIAAAGRLWPDLAALTPPAHNSAA
ncbi:2-dehydro-3-deoxygalactonokinase [Methylobrevis albus]|uniref:2-dehydro-3-deoxygalactonokinase n=1 Tax=Methylobrevis albus TaxID=2793297 RepID=UPI002E28BE34|nr:2-dehydro-3-deoxygalactonokinase [Methylobrevis albus]